MEFGNQEPPDPMNPPTEVVVEPTGSQAGGTDWLVRKGGMFQSRHNLKDAAVKKARKMARGANGSLKIHNKDMSVSETANYQ